MAPSLSAKLLVVVATPLLFFSSACFFPFGLQAPLKWHLTLEPDSSTPLPNNFLSEATEVLKHRLERLKLSNFSVKSGAFQIIVDLPAVKDPERIRKILTSEGRLEIVHVISPASPAPVQTFPTRDEALNSLGGKISSDRRLVSYLEASDTAGQGMRWAIVDAEPIVPGTGVKNAAATPSAFPDRYQILFYLKPDAAQRFGEWTKVNINQYVGIALNGELKSIAYIRSQINDTGQISGRFTKEHAEDLAEILNSGPLPGPLKLVKESVDSDH